MKLALIGAGQRGMIYADYAVDRFGSVITAVVDPNEIHREEALKKFNVGPEGSFTNVEDFFAKGKIADACIIASMDQDHYKQTMKALEVGYDILLEKPISPDPKECIAIQEKANECKRKIVVCHVLRYTAFFGTIKQIIDSGELGKVVTIQHAENVGNFHMAHSFVRGNWRNSQLSSPIIMQKSCHDMDILVWLAGSNAKKISSFGNLSFFNEEHAPQGSTEMCFDCPVAKDCRFDAMKAYLPIRGGWPATVVSEDQSEEGLTEVLKTSPYGRCVFRCDNNVCDNQVTDIEFENGITATFHLSGLTNKMHRTIKIMCENGDIYGDDEDGANYITVTKFSSNSRYEGEEKTIKIGAQEGFHGGGDFGLTKDFLEAAMNSAEKSESRSSIDQSIESHIMAYAAEQSRVTGKVVYLDELKEELRKQIHMD